MANIPLFKVFMPESVADQVKATLMSGYIGQGPKVNEFEKALVPWMGHPNILSLNSGTSALYLALKLAGVDYQDEVITSPQSCMATNTPIIEHKAKIVWADIDPWTGNISPMDVERKITSKTKAIIAVHWGGYPCEINELQRISKKYGIPIIEDAAHSFGSVYQGRKVGSLSQFTCFSGTSPVMTDHGKVKIKSISVGDMVLSSDGKYHKVLHVHKNTYKGNWTRLAAGQSRLNATSEHPVKIYREGADYWLPAGDVRVGDKVYVLTKKCERCSQLVPIYGRICGFCYLEANSCLGKRQKVQEARTKHCTRKTSRLIHHAGHVAPVMEEYRKNGYRVIPLIHALPDFIAVKDGKLTAVEVESGTSIRLGKVDKYEKLNGDSYDDVVWITRGKKIEVATRYSYEICGAYARVPVSYVKTIFNKRSMPVYNLMVEGDPTYFVHGVLVHNCFSFQAIKHLTTVDGGALVASTNEGYRRGKLLRWYGIDRETPKRDMRCEDDVTETGGKMHMNDVCATIGLEQLKHVQKILDTHRDNAKFYDERLEGLRRVKKLRYENDRLSAYWLYTVLVGDQESFYDHMDKNGVMVSKVHVRNDVHTCFREFRKNLPGVDQFASSEMCIPVGWWVTKEDREKIVRAIVEWDAK